MCGIAGILTTNADLDLGPALEGMLRALRHRGPDDEGREEVALPGGYRLGLAQTRLAILDLSPAGHQPMTDSESGSWIIYNGEVYNHQQVRRRLGGPFHSTSDTETILKGWVQQGETMLASLRGMFAFALYDGRRRQLWLVRDRLGVKPLYVSRTADDTWVFASELRSLLASGLVGRRLRPEAVEAYLAFGAVPAPWTLLDGVESVLPGECWRFDLNRPAASPERKRYWRPPFAVARGPAPTREEALERLRPVLAEAASLRMLADVPVGVFLSGGIDSSGLVALLAHAGHNVRTFSVVFGEADFDESDHSRLVARHFGTEHAELFLHPTRVLGEMDRALEAYDQPSIDGVNTYFISQATRQAGVKVALSGLGGDELFAGYPYFRILARLERGLPRQLARLTHLALRWLAPGSARTVKLGAVLEGHRSRLDRYAACRQVLSPERRAALFPAPALPRRKPLPGPVHAGLEAEVSDLDPVNAHSLLELSLYLADMLLRDADQMSMAHALEVREPLLDHILVETVAGLPGPLKLTPSRQSRIKGLLVDALPTPLPRPVLRRAKMGFVLPWERWLRHGLKDHVAAVLTDAAGPRAAGLDAAAVSRLWTGFLRGEPGIRYTDILCLVHLLSWARRHRLEMADGQDAAPTSARCLLTPDL